MRAPRCVPHHNRTRPPCFEAVLSIVSETVRIARSRTGRASGAIHTLRRRPVTEQPEDSAPHVRVTVYGSCVARDTVDLAGSEHFDVVAYIARQSLLSADHDASPRFPAEVEIDS